MGLEHWLPQKIRGVSNYSESYFFFFPPWVHWITIPSRQCETSHFNSRACPFGEGEVPSMPWLFYGTEIGNTVPTLAGSSLGRVKRWNAWFGVFKITLGHTVALVSWARAVPARSRLCSGCFLVVPAGCSFCPRNSCMARLETSKDGLNIYGIIENNSLVFISIFNLHGWVIGTESIFYLKRRDKFTEVVNFTVLFPFCVQWEWRGAEETLNSWTKEEHLEVWFLSLFRHFCELWLFSAVPLTKD